MFCFHTKNTSLAFEVVTTSCLHIDRYIYHERIINKFNYCCARDLTSGAGCIKTKLKLTIVNANYPS